MSLKDDLFDYETWAHRLSRETHTPATTIEAMHPDALGYEIAVMLADDIRHEARYFAEKKPSERVAYIRGTFQQRMTWRLWQQQKAGD